jgi:hypothetical protein
MGISKSELAIITAIGGTFEVADGAHMLGTISGSGTTKVDAGASLTAVSIVQNTLTIGAGASVTISPTTGAAGASAVPEPGTWVLLIAGATGLLIQTWFRWNRTVAPTPPSA